MLRKNSNSTDSLKDSDGFTNGWNTNVEKLLISWARQISINQKEHKKKWRLYRIIGVVLVIVAAVLSAVTASSALNQYIADKQSKIGLLIIIIFSAVAAVIIGLKEIFDFIGVSDKHYIASIDYASLNRTIASCLIQKRGEREHASKFLTSVREQFREILKGAPELDSDEIVNDLEEVIFKNPQHATGKHTPRIIFKEKDPTDLEKGIIPETPKISLQFQETYIKQKNTQVPELDYQWERLARFEEK